jgi:hypothetical protein
MEGEGIECTSGGSYSRRNGSSSGGSKAEFKKKPHTDRGAR